MDKITDTTPEQHPDAACFVAAVEADEQLMFFCAAPATREREAEERSARINAGVMAAIDALTLERQRAAAPDTHDEREAA